jgi:manganese oxidase
LPMWIDFVVEYTAGFAFGLFIFQALFMKGMMGGTYSRALKSSYIPEWFSMNMMAAGMFPVMIFLMMGRDMRAMEPTESLFWGVMSLGVIVGFFVAYPVNVWMVSRNLKHGLMYVSTPGGSVDQPGTAASLAPTGAVAPGRGSHGMGGK